MRDTRSRRRAALPGIAPKVAVLILVVVGVLVLFGSSLAPQDPLAQDVANLLHGPSSKHWFGTDYLGRDVFSRLLAGTRESVVTALAAVEIALVLGAIPGLLSVMWRGFDVVANRIADAVMTLPTLVFAIALIAVLGNHLAPVMFAVGFLTAPQFFRVTRAAAMTYAGEQYVEAAELLGMSRLRTLVVHITPKVLPTIAVTAASAVAVALLAVSSLMFLGIGVVPPAPTWGGVLSSDLNYLSQMPWAPIFPAAFILLTAGSLNVLADTLRDSDNNRRRAVPAEVAPVGVLSSELNRKENPDAERSFAA